jgi:hypothetical protein
VRRFAFSVVVLAACGRGGRPHERYELIRDSAYEMGLHNAALLAGIAISETGLAHCYDEAPSFACPGPASPSCGGAPVIAGGADGPCADRQGGLGMFQFDAGTYDDTLALYGPQILTVEGNAAQAVWFVEDKVERDITDAGWRAAMAWINAVPLDAASPAMERWAQLLACRYNGCCDRASATCRARANGYRDNALTALADTGPEFWDVSGRCSALPADGVIDERSDCYVAGGDPRHWRRETTGYGGALDWTLTTSAAAPANFGEWIVKARGAYHVEVYLDGGKFGRAAHARYEVRHGGVDSVVVVDQSAGAGFVSLGDYVFAGTGDEHVLLGDNAGDANARLLFDALRVTPLEGGAATNGCRSAGAAAVVGLLLLVLLRRRQTRAR